MKIGLTLSKMRKKSGYSQEALADILGVARPTISSWETDNTMPEVSYIVQMSKLYDCSLDDLLNPTPTPPSRGREPKE